MMDDNNIVDILNGFNLPQVLVNGDLVENKEVSQDDLVENDLQIESKLFQSLKFHIDSQCKLNKLYQSRIRSFERFHRYCQRVVQFGGDENFADKFDLEQFRNEYNRFDRNYRYWRKRVRKLRNETKSNPYDTLYELFSKIKSFNEEKCLDNNLKKLDDQYLPNDRIDPEINLIETIPSAVLNNNNIETTPHENVDCDFHCFVDGCGQMFSTKCVYLDHLFEHSIDANQTVPSKISTKTKCSKKKILPKKPSPIKTPTPGVRSSKRQTKSFTAKKIEPKKKSAKNATKKNEKAVSKIKPTKSTKTSPKQGKTTTTTNLKGKKDRKKPSSKANQEPTKELSKLKFKNRKKKLKKKGKNSASLYKCPFEDCTFEHKHSFAVQTHQAVHTDARPFKCDQCDLTFKYQGTLSQHFKKIHIGVRFECPFEGCISEFPTTYILRNHIQVAHTKSPPEFHCPVEGCNYSAYKKACLQQHSAVHSDDRPDKCPWPGCGKTFKRSVNLRNHLRMHKNERQFKCKYPDCSYACNTSCNLRKHHAIHEKKDESFRKLIQEPNQQNLTDHQPQPQQNQQQQFSEIPIMDTIEMVALEFSN